MVLFQRWESNQILGHVCWWEVHFPGDSGQWHCNPIHVWCSRWSRGGVKWPGLAWTSLLVHSFTHSLITYYIHFQLSWRFFGHIFCKVSLPPTAARPQHGECSVGMFLAGLHHDPDFRVHAGHRLTVLSEERRARLFI